MLTFRKGTGGAPTAALAMAEHLREQTLPEEMVAMADYYLRGVQRAEMDGTAALPRQDMKLAVARALGIDVNRTATHEEVVNLLQGRRADGEPIAGKREQKLAPGKDRITYVDFTFSAPKSVSVAMALAPTDAERHMIVGAHRDAWMAAMAHLEAIVAQARKGAGGSKGRVAGSLAWVSFDHYTARPTIEIPHTEADGTKTTLIQTVKVAGDMQLHTHVTTPNVVVCPDGSVGGMDMLALHDRVHEIGAYYQAHLATHLRAHGIEVVLDERTESARLPVVPESVCEVFSKRVRDGEAAAREYVQAQGLDWDAMHPMELAGVLKGGARATRRQKETGKRGDDISDLAAWKAQAKAKAAGYEHESVIRQDANSQLPPTEQDRLRRAYAASLPVLERQLSRRATMHASVARTAAARGLIAAGVESARDIDRITAAMREHGVRHDGQQVPLVWAELEADAKAEHPEGRRKRVKITTTLHVDQEREAMRLAASATADPGGTLTAREIEQAVRRVSERDGLDFTTEHGREQRRVMDVLGTAGRFAVAVGVAGAGKSTLLRPLVDAWRADPGRDGETRQVYGTALAWRQSDLLADAGIRRENTMAVAAMLARAEKGKLPLNGSSVVVVDELSQVGTSQMLRLLRLQAKHGFKMVAIGDDRQAQAIEAGNSIGLLRRALGNNAVPELESTVRQLRERDRETTLLFRQGKAQEGIERLREDGQTVLVPGGRRQAIEAVADLWIERHRVNADRERYTLTVSAPTNADAREIAGAIRERRRNTGELGGDEITLQATDQTGAEYDLPLAKCDRVRLFKRTNATIGGRSSNIGHNGSVLEVERIEQAGLQMRNAKGTTGLVRWESLRDEETGRVRLTYGDVLTIDAIQSATSTEHINALPSGSAAVHSFTGYVAQSRSREATFLVVSDGRERSEILGKRALGNIDPITEDQVWANVGVNLARRPDKGLATDLLESADRIYTGTVRSLATAFQPMQQREAEGRERSTLHRGFAKRRDTQDVAKAAPAMKTAAERRAAATRSAAAEAYREMREARRSMRAPAARPKRNRREVPSSQAEQAPRDSQRRHQEAPVSRAVTAIWDRAEPVRTHPYLVRKGIEAHGLRQNRRGELLVPMRDIEGRLWSVQTITSDGRTFLWRGGRKRGTHALLGELQPGAPVVIAVGFAAAATMREVTGLATIAAFDSGNLMAVAQAYRERDPQRPIILAADNDHNLPRRQPPLPNVGLQKAAQAAEAVRGLVLTPSFRSTDQGTDWNDVAVREGLATVRKQAVEALRSGGIELGKWKQPSVMDQATRDAARERRSPPAAGEREGMQHQHRGSEPEVPEFGL